MSRIAKSLNIEGRKEYTIKELKNDHVLIVLDLFESLDTDEKDEKSQPLSDFILKNLKKLLEWCSDIPIEDFKDFSMSETKQVWDVFKAANPFFFQWISKYQMEKRLETTINLILETSIMAFAKSLQASSDKDIQQPGVMVGALPKSALKKP